MQASLFQEAPTATEPLDDIHRELLEKAELLYPGKFFVFSRGPHDAEVVVVGESPGPPDRLTSIPFTGPAGDLLFKILSSIDLNPDDCYLTNIVKFISQGDEITSEMLAFFTPFLKREILAVGPRLIISLGNSPTRALLNSKSPISKLRGEIYEFEGIKLIPTFNPAYLLRDASKKKEVWEDMKRVRVVLRIQSGS